jgi:hypothetical protein
MSKRAVEPLTFWAMNFCSSFLLVAVVLLGFGVTPTTSQNPNCTMRTSHWEAKKNNQNQPLCCVDTPSDVIIARSRAQCQSRCSTSGQGYWNANYFNDSQRCEMYYYPPVNFLANVQQCQHFEVLQTVPQYCPKLTNSSPTYTIIGDYVRFVKNKHVKCWLLQVSIYVYQLRVVTMKQNYLGMHLWVIYIRRISHSSIVR